MQQEKQTPAPAGERAENTALSVGAGDPSAAEELSAREAPAADRAAGADGAVNADGSAGADGEVNAKSAAGPDGSAGAPEGYTRAELRGRRRKNIIFGLVSLAIIACVISVLFRLGDTLAGGDSATFAEMLAGLDWRYLLVVVALFVVAFVCDSLKFTLLNRCNGYSLGFHKDMKMALTGKYYENITPTGTGGQPMQIYYLYKQGIPGAKSKIGRASCRERV